MKNVHDALDLWRLDDARDASSATPARGWQHWLAITGRHLAILASDLVGLLIVCGAINTQQSWTIFAIGALLLADAFHAGQYNRKPLIVAALGGALIKLLLLFGVFIAVGLAGSQPPLDLVAGGIALPLVLLAARYVATAGLTALDVSRVPVLLVGRRAGLQWSQQMLAMGQGHEYLLVGQVNIEHLDLDAGVDWQSLAGRCRRGAAAGDRQRARPGGIRPAQLPHARAHALRDRAT